MTLCLINTMLLLIAAIFSTSLFQSDPLDQFLWKKRIVIISSDPSDTGPVMKQLDWFKKTRKEFDDRDLVLIHLKGNSATIDGVSMSDSNSKILRERFPRSKGFTLYLLGKDGGTKLLRNDAVNPLEIYQLIDSMPMRQREIREKQEQSGGQTSQTAN